MSGRVCLMKYNGEQDRWLVNLGGRDYRLHCGEGFDLAIAGQRIPCRLELDLQWYVVLPDTRFYLRPRDTYKVWI